MDASASARRVVAEAAPLLERLLFTVRVGVVVSDARAPDMPVVYVNPAFEEITGYAAAEVTGRNCRFLQGEDTDPEAVAELRRGLAAGEAVSTTLLNYRRDGTPFWNEIRVAPVPGADGTLYYLGLLTDVTRRVHAERELARTAAVHSSVFEAIADGIMVIAADAAVIDINPAALAILRLSREDLQRRDWWVRLDARHRDGTPLAQSESPGMRVSREGRGIHGVQLLVRRGDGADRLIAMNYEPYTGGPAGAASGLVVSFRDDTDRQRAAEDLEKFAALVAISDDLIAIAGLDDHLLYVNSAGRDLVGLGPEEDVTGLKIQQFLAEDAWERFTATARSEVLRGERWEGETTLRHLRTAEAIPVRASTFLVRHPESGQPWALATIQRDISQERRVTAALVQSRERYEAQFRSLPLPTYVWERQGDEFVLIEWNEMAESMSLGSLPTLAGVKASECYADAPEILLAFERCWSTRSHITRELRLTLPATGRARDLILTFACVSPDLVLLHALDITQRVESERRLRLLSEQDDLTGLFNRRYFERCLTESLGRIDVAVLLIDVDHFKFVNDSLGHKQGDELLCEVAHAMRSRLRPSDVLARFGGDEFAVLLRDADQSHAHAAANHLLGAIRSKVIGVSVTASAGAAVFASGVQAGASDAIVAADIALYQAKQSGRDRVELYAGQAGESLTWLQQIRRAIAEDRLVLHGQPVIGLRGRECPPMYELLVRMVDEHGALIPPTSFLPTAEQFGLIRDIDRWVLERGVEFAARGNFVSLNMSARSLADPELAQRVADALARTGAAPHNVCLEFTETAAVSSVEDARALTAALRELGCPTALDDFGTGFGTFVLLKHLPVSALKIDKEFVRGLSSSAADQRIVRAIVQIAAEANMRTVAEGVEDAGALALLREYGIDYAQGFHIARPGPLPL